MKIDNILAALLSTLPESIRSESFVTLSVERQIDLIRDLVLLTERAKGQTETVSHRGLDHADECHFQTGRPP